MRPRSVARLCCKNWNSAGPGTDKHSSTATGPGRRACVGCPRYRHVPWGLGFSSPGYQSAVSAVATTTTKLRREVPALRWHIAARLDYREHTYSKRAAAIFFALGITIVADLAIALTQANPTSSFLKTKLLRIKGIGCGLVTIWRLGPGVLWGDDVRG